MSAVLEVNSNVSLIIFRPPVKSDIEMRSTASGNIATLADLTVELRLSAQSISCRCQTERSPAEAAALAGFPLAPIRERCLIKRFYKLKLTGIYFSWSGPVEGDGAS